MQFVTVVALVVAQATFSSSRPSASCADALRFVVQMVETNYPGVRDKVTAVTRVNYETRLARARDAAQVAMSDSACHSALADYVGFYRDGHLRVHLMPPSAGPAPSPDSIRRAFATTPTRPVPAEEVLKTIDPRGTAVGIWESLDGTYRLALVPDSTAETLVLIVLRGDGVFWVPGQVKAWLRARTDGHYDARYFMRDHTPRAVLARFKRNVLELDGINVALVRVAPTMPGDLSSAEYRDSIAVRPRFRRVDAQTVSLRIPSFEASQATAVEGLVAMHRAEINASAQLVLDLRGNGGGSDFVYQSLIPLLYTGPIRQVNTSTLATPDNVAAFERVLSDSNFPESAKADIRARVAELRAHMGQLVPAPDDSLVLAEVLAQPTRVGILIDRHCASSCEEFVLAARQSTKVTLFGENTAGILDYANVTTLAVPDSRFMLQYPTSRSQRLPADPVDPDGITPAVRLPREVPDAEKWVAYQLRTGARPARAPKIARGTVSGGARLARRGAQNTVSPHGEW